MLEKMAEGAESVAKTLAGTAANARGRRERINLPKSACLVRFD